MMENGGKKSLLRIGTPLCGLVCGIVGVAVAGKHYLFFVFHKVIEGVEKRLLRAGLCRGISDGG